jgi:hypothetical protein
MRQPSNGPSPSSAALSSRSSAKALWDDRSSVGADNQVFKLMLGLLCLGAIIAILAGANVLGNFPKAA